MSTAPVRQSDRVSVPTEKKRLIELEKYNKKKDSEAKRIYNLISKLDTMLQAEGDSKAINDNEAELQKLYNTFSELHISSKVFIAEENIAAAELEADKVKESVLAHQRRYHEHLEATPSLKSQKSRKSRTSCKSSKSESSGRSSKSGSSRSSKILDKKAKLAELVLEQKYIAERQRQEKLMKVQEEQLRQKQQALQDEEKLIKEMKEEADNLKIKYEIEKAEAALKVYQEEEQEDLDKDLADLETTKDQKALTTEYIAGLRQSKVSPKTQPVIESVIKQANESQLLTLVKRNKAPSIDLEVFSGSSIDYPYFMATFVQVVEENVQSERERLSLLVKYTKGDIKELVKSCVYLKDDVCYVKAKELLERKFGSPFRIAADYRKQLSAWPKVRPSDATALNKFETFLLKYQSSMTSVGQSTDNSPELLQLLQSKLPTYMQDRWNRRAYKARSKLKREPSLDDFIDLVSKETVLLDDPLYSREAIFDLTRNSYERSKFKANTVKLDQCICCTQTAHDLEKCQKYLRMDVTDRKEFIFRNRLCFSCLKPTNQSHNAKTCTDKRQCAVCKQYHPTTLHKFKLITPPPTRATTTVSTNAVSLPPVPQPNPLPVFPPVSSVSPIVTVSQPIVSGCVSSNSKTACLSIVKVKVCHPSKPQNCIETFALLDNGSQGTFITKEVSDKLGIEGTETVIEIQTVTGSIQEKTSYIDNLQVSPINDSVGSKVELPSCYTRTTLPADSSDVATPYNIRNWSYLSNIRHHLPEVTNQTVIGLLIGTNCPQALEPIEVIHSQGSGPYAYRTRLGWCVSGPISLSSNSFNCHRINVTKVEKVHKNVLFVKERETVKVSNYVPLLLLEVKVIVINKMRVVKEKPKKAFSSVEHVLLNNDTLLTEQIEDETDFNREEKIVKKIQKDRKVMRDVRRSSDRYRVMKSERFDVLYSRKRWRCIQHKCYEFWLHCCNWWSDMKLKVKHILSMNLY